MTHVTRQPLPLHQDTVRDWWSGYTPEGEGNRVHSHSEVIPVSSHLKNRCTSKWEATAKRTDLGEWERNITALGLGLKSQCLQAFSSCYELKKASTTWEQNPRGGPWWTEMNLTMPRALGGSWPGQNQNPGLFKPDQLNSWYLLDTPLLSLKPGSVCFICVKTEWEENLCWGPMWMHQTQENWGQRIISSSPSRGSH